MKFSLSATVRSLLRIFGRDMKYGVDTKTDENNFIFRFDFRQASMLLWSCRPAVDWTTVIGPALLSEAADSQMKRIHVHVVRLLSKERGGFIEGQDESSDRLLLRATEGAHSQCAPDRYPDVAGPKGAK